VATVTGAEWYAHELPKWRKFQYRVRSRDEAGNWSAWAESNSILAIRRQERSFRRHGAWHIEPTAGAMKGKTAVSSTAGSWASLSFGGNGVALVMPTGPGLGTVRACVDAGTSAETCKTVDLAAFAPADTRVLVATFTLLPPGNHTLVVTVVSGTVKLDGALATT
jgi:hypothetical protein